MKRIYLLLSLVSCLSLGGYSQNETSNNDNLFNARAPYCNPCKKRHYSHCTPPSNTPVPFDGGLSVLLVAGAAYGVKRMARKKPQA